MSLGRAVLYFLSEALTGLRRSWKVSLLAILTMSVSLLTGGAFMLVSGNFARVAREWRAESRIVVYLAAEAGPVEIGRLTRAAQSAPWIDGVTPVSRSAAARRFSEIFPDLASLVADGEEGPLPPSLEISYDWSAVPAAVVDGWLQGIQADPSVEMVDDDRRWLERLDLWIVVARTLGVILSAILLAAATFTIAGVVRLTAHLYREEIRVMRLVGATELYIRGPFLAAGVIQGATGAAVALIGLGAAYLASGAGLPMVLGSTLFSGFLSAAQLATLLALGALAGALGAALPMRRARPADEKGPGKISLVPDDSVVVPDQR